MKQEATLSYAIMYIVIFAMMIFIFVVGTPFLIEVNTSFIDSAETMNTNTLKDVAKITNASLRTTMEDIMSHNADSYATYGIAVEKWIQYSWMFILFIVTLIVVVLARRAEMMYSRGGLI